MSRGIMNNLKTLRKMHKLNQTDMAKLLGTNQNQYSRYERGERELKESQITDICEKFNITSDWLLGKDNKVKIEQIILEIAERIANTNEKVKFTDIMSEIDKENLTKLRNNDIEIIKLLIIEHNLRFENE
jgi:transcriptional regulator with XRE-family HTH domain